MFNFVKFSRIIYLRTIQADFIIYQGAFSWVTMSSYERERARNAYKKQLDHFKNEIRHELRNYRTIDFDAKMKIKFKAMGLRRECLDNYRESVRGIEYDLIPHEFKNFWGEVRSLPIKNKNIHVLQCEEDLMEGLDKVVNNIDLLTDDNKEKILFLNDFACYTTSACSSYSTPDYKSKFRIA